MACGHRYLLSILFLAALSVSSVWAADQRKTLRIAWWGSQTRHEMTIQVLQMFEAENPGIKVSYEYGNFNDYWTRLTTLAAGNNLPDVMQQDYQYLTEWVKRGLVVPLDEYAAMKTLDFSDVADSYLAGGRTQGKLYGVSLGVNSTCIVLDAAAFRKAGIPLPPYDWTWADFERIALELTRRLGITAVSGNIVHDHIWRSMYLGRGLWAYNANGTALGYPESEDAVFAGQLRMAKRLTDAGAMIPWGEAVALRYKALDSDWIVTGRSAITFLWSNQVVALWTAAGIGSRLFELRPLPRVGPAAASSNYLKPSMFFSITKNATMPDTAARLIDYFTNSLDANETLLAERGVPIAAKVRSALGPLVPAPQRAVFDFLDRIQAVAAPVPPPDPVGNTDLINNVFIPQVIDPVMFGMIPPEAAMKKLRQESVEILNK
jgi:multiple sugar transport system substrate-binding protein